MMNGLSLLAFFLLVALVAGRALMLKQRGVKAFVFGATDKSDFLLLPAVAFLVYALLSSAFGWPMPRVLSTPLYRLAAVRWAGLALCYASLCWFALTLKYFGNSFRVGIDEKAPDKLITGGTFSLSRNPIYLAFFMFVTGMLVIYPTAAVLLFAGVLAAAIHRQVLREEAFLRTHYGAAYEDYCRHVRRYGGRY